MRWLLRQVFDRVDGNGGLVVRGKIFIGYGPFSGDQGDVL
jgi:hypothetical protein